MPGNAKVTGGKTTKVTGGKAPAKGGGGGGGHGYHHGHHRHHQHTKGGKAMTRSQAKSTPGIRRAMIEGRDVSKNYKGPLKPKDLKINKSGKVVSAKKSAHGHKSPHLTRWRKFMEQHKNKKIGTIVKNDKGVQYEVGEAKNGLRVLRKV